jgi:DNA modification methylase
LIRLVTPKGGTVYDPFAGSGTTLIAAKELEVNSIGVELSEEYCKIIQDRIDVVTSPLEQIL